MNHRALNKTLALVLWGKSADGSDDVAVYPGVLTQSGGRYYLQRRTSQSQPELPPEWLGRISEVPSDLRETLCDCEFQLSLTVGDVSDQEAEGFAEFGLTWPA